MATVVDRTKASRVGEIFTDLGAAVAARWRISSLDDEAFAHIASEELSRIRLSQAIDYRTLIAWVMSSETLPFQQDFGSHFGQPPITLFWHPRFYIQALFWSTATTAIHNHAFAGAFTILSGESLQTTYRFTERIRVNAQLSIGELRTAETMVLGVGATQAILPGGAFIHSAWHLERPSVTIVVRTHSESIGQPRREYIPPGIALDPFWVDQQLTRRLQCMKLLSSIDSPDYETEMSQLILDGDVLTAVVAARQLCGDRINEPELCARVMEAAQARWPPYSDLFAPLYAEAIRRSVAQTGREVIQEPRLRLLLGLVASYRGRRSLVDTFARYCRSQDPETEIVAALRELSDAGVLPVELDDVSAGILRDQLSRVTTIDDLRSSDSAQTSALMEDLKHVSILRPLFADD